MPGFTINNTSSITSIDHKAQFHRSHRWYIEKLGAPLGASGTSEPNRSRLYAKTLELPSRNFETELVDGANIQYKFPKRVTWDNVTVIFYDVWGIHLIFDKWQSNIWHPDTGFNVAEEYKGEAQFVLTDGKGDVVQRYTLIGCYPSKVSHGELSAESSEVKLLHVTYAFDYAKIEIGDVRARREPGTKPGIPRASRPPVVIA